MTQCIPSDVAKLDANGDGNIDRLYVGTTGGRVWRFDIGDPDPANWTAKNVFKVNPGGTEKRKIFYPPDITLERDGTGAYEMLFLGTGDREDPKEKTISNRLYAFKDRNLASVVGDSQLQNVTDSYIASDALKNYGWYITLENQSEKCLATPVVFYKAVYYTTFTASTAVISGDDPCYVGEGTARLYVVRYDTGNAVFNFDLTNDVGETKVIAKSDRSIMIGTAIPSGVIITFIGGTAVAYTGVGGGVYAPELSSTNPLVPMTWRIVF
jgi:type IV pilus assembly protein PilY1